MRWHADPPQWAALVGSGQPGKNESEGAGLVGRRSHDPLSSPAHACSWADGFLLGVSLSALLGLLSFALAWAVFS